MCISHFSRLSVSRHTLGPTVYISLFQYFWVLLMIFLVKECLCLIFTFFSLLAIFQVLQLVYFIFHVFQYLAIFQVQQCAFLIFHVFEFLPIFSFKNCLWLIATISGFSRYCRSYSVHFSFFMFFSDSPHSPCRISGPKMCVSHLAVFSVFLAIWQVI